MTMTTLRRAAVAVALAALAMPAAAATVQPTYQSVSTGTTTTQDGSTLWEFGRIWDGRRWGDRLHGHSTVRVTGSDACTSVAAGSECLFATIDYFNAVNLGAGKGQGETDTARVSLALAGLGLQVALSLTVDRTVNGMCASRYGCADQFSVAFTSALDGFRVEGNGRWVEEDTGHRLRLFWTRPFDPVPVPTPIPMPGPRDITEVASVVSITPVPVPASSGLMLGAVALAAAAAARRRSR